MFQKDKKRYAGLEIPVYMKITKRKIALMVSYDLKIDTLYIWLTFPIL